MNEFGKNNETSREWTMKELEDKLPNYIKKIITDNKLVSLRYNTVCCNIKELSLFISITYIDEDEFFKNNIIIGHKEGLDFLSIYSDLPKNNFHIKKRAEIFFSSTGEFIKCKLRLSESEWITIYRKIKI